MKEFALWLGGVCLALAGIVGVLAFGAVVYYTVSGLK